MIKQLTNSLRIINRLKAKGLMKTTKLLLQQMMINYMTVKSMNNRVTKPQINMAR